MVNGLGNEFLPKVEERYALPVRDIMMKAMFREIDEGRGTPHGGVFIDLRSSPRSKTETFELLRKLDSLPYTELRDLGVDITKDPIEVKPGTHYCLGGVHINERTETNVPGVYAAGEVSGNIHGANRTSGNALAETQVCGRRAGRICRRVCRRNPAAVRRPGGRRPGSPAPPRPRYRPSRRDPTRRGADQAQADDAKVHGA